MRQLSTELFDKNQLNALWKGLYNSVEYTEDELYCNIVGSEQNFRTDGDKLIKISTSEKILDNKDFIEHTYYDLKVKTDNLYDQINSLKKKLNTGLMEQDDLKEQRNTYQEDIDILLDVKESKLLDLYNNLNNNNLTIRDINDLKKQLTELDDNIRSNDNLITTWKERVNKLYKSYNRDKKELGKIILQKHYSEQIMERLQESYRKLISMLELKRHKMKLNEKCVNLQVIVLPKNKPVKDLKELDDYEEAEYEDDDDGEEDDLEEDFLENQVVEDLPEEEVDLTVGLEEDNDLGIPPTEPEVKDGSNIEIDNVSKGQSLKEPEMLPVVEEQERCDNEFCDTCEHDVECELCKEHDSLEINDYKEIFVLFKKLKSNDLLKDKKDISINNEKILIESLEIHIELIKAQMKSGINEKKGNVVKDLYISRELNDKNSDLIAFTIERDKDTAVFGRFTQSPAVVLNPKLQEKIQKVMFYSSLALSVFLMITLIFNLEVNPFRKDTFYLVFILASAVVCVNIYLEVRKGFLASFHYIERECTTVQVPYYVYTSKNTKIIQYQEFKVFNLRFLYNDNSIIHDSLSNNNIIQLVNNQNQNLHNQHKGLKATFTDLNNNKNLLENENYLLKISNQNYQRQIDIIKADARANVDPLEKLKVHDQKVKAKRTSLIIAIGIIVGLVFYILYMLISEDEVLTNDEGQVIVVEQSYTAMWIGIGITAILAPRVIKS